MTLFPRGCRQYCGEFAKRHRRGGAAVFVREMPTVVGDRVQLVKLLQNLIGNAMLCRGEPPPRIQIIAQRDDALWEFLLRDNGIVIAPEYHQRIFEIFRRLHGRHDYPRTGNGLAVCKKIVPRHGGKIT